MLVLHFRTEGDRACCGPTEELAIPPKRSTRPVLINLPWALRRRHRHKTRLVHRRNLGLVEMETTSAISISRRPVSREG